MKKVVMVLSDFFKPDPRVHKEARSLTENCYEVKIVCFDWEKKHPKRQVIDGIEIERIRIPFSASLYRRTYRAPLFMFWLKVFFKLLKSDFDAIHCHDFDTMPVGFFLKKIRRIKLIYDAHEYYPALARNLAPQIVYKLIKLIDDLFVRSADCMILPCDERRFFYPQAKKVIIALNTPKNMRIPRKKKDEMFTIFYAGGLDEQKGITFVIKVIEKLSDVRLILAGWGPKIKVLEEISAKNKNIAYIGEITQKEVLSKLAVAHATFAFYEPSNEQNIYAASNKVFEAMMAGVPIIINEETAPSKIVEQNHCGLIIPYGDVSALKEAILLLKNDSRLREKFGQSGRRAFKLRYDWGIMEQSFVKEYAKVICAT